MPVGKPFKRFPLYFHPHTWLKPGVNERRVRDMLRFTLESTISHFPFVAQPGFAIHHALIVN